LFGGNPDLKLLRLGAHGTQSEQRILICQYNCNGTLMWAGLREGAVNQTGFPGHYRKATRLPFSTLPGGGLARFGPEKRL
jgi:hypothetical protein